MGGFGLPFLLELVMRVMGIDATYQLQRCRFAADKIKEGCRLTVLKLFLASTIKEIHTYGPDRVYCFWDPEGGSARRKSMTDDYKSNRSSLNMDNPSDKALVDAQPLAQKILKRIGAINMSIKGYEADDLGFYLTREDWVKEGRLLSEDRDWFLGVNEKWETLRPKSKDLLTLEKFHEWFGADNSYDMYDLYLTYKAFVGDKSDNVKGISGIGGINAVKFAKALQRNELDQHSGKYAGIVRDNLERIVENKSIMDMSWVLESFEVKEAFCSAHPLLNNPVEYQDIVLFNQNGVNLFPQWNKISDIQKSLRG